MQSWAAGVACLDAAGAAKKRYACAGITSIEDRSAHLGSWSYLAAAYHCLEAAHQSHVWMPQALAGLHPAAAGLCLFLPLEVHLCVQPPAEHLSLSLLHAVLQSAAEHHCCSAPRDPSGLPTAAAARFLGLQAHLDGQRMTLPVIAMAEQSPARSPLATVAHQAPEAFGHPCQITRLYINHLCRAQGVSLLFCYTTRLFTIQFCQATKGIFAPPPEYQTSGHQVIQSCLAGCHQPVKLQRFPSEIIIL